MPAERLGSARISGVESILGTIWTRRLVGETMVGPHRAVVPRITGRAWITGSAEYVVDPSDPFPAGFKVGDIWGSKALPTQQR
jgi:proline racemase